MPGCSGEPVVTTLVCFLPFSAREAAGALRARRFLRPPLSREDVSVNLARKTRGEIAELCLAVIARSNATKQSSFLHFRKESWIASLRSQ
jgi:hypothetical protein